MVRLRRTARKSVPGGPYRVEGFQMPEQVFQFENVNSKWYNDSKGENVRLGKGKVELGDMNRKPTGNRLLLALGMSADEAQPQRPKARPRLRDFTDEASPWPRITLRYQLFL
ncbi:hypothetical protein AgCh_010734 [Apium graveolens]